MRALISFVFLVFCLFLPAHVATAADAVPWKFHGDINWTHPDGTKYKGRYANTKVGANTLSLIWATERKKLYIQFRYTSNNKLSRSKAQFYFYTTKKLNNRNRAAFGHKIIVKPNSNGKGGIIVAEFKADDFVTYSKHYRNHLSVDYRARGVGQNEKSYTFSFLGTGLAKAFNEINITSRRPAKTASSSSAPVKTNKTRHLNCGQLLEKANATCDHALWKCERASNCSALKKACPADTKTKAGCQRLTECGAALAKKRKSRRYCQYGWSSPPGTCYLQKGISESSYTYNCPGHSGTSGPQTVSPETCSAQFVAAAKSRSSCRMMVDEWNNRCAKSIKMNMPKTCSF